MPAFELPSLPLTSPGLVFATLVALVLVAPVLAERVRVPGIAGLLAAGALVGPSTLGVLSSSGIVSLLAELGLLFLVFETSLGFDLDTLRRARRSWTVVGGLVFLLPLALGAGAATMFGSGPAAAILVGAWWATHSVVAYPVYDRLGLGEDRSVRAAVGGTIVANTASLLLVVLVAWVTRAPLDWMFWALLVPKLVGFAVMVFWVLPLLARWFFAGIGQDRSVRFLFLLAALFGAIALAEVVGLEGIAGAYLAGLALNRLVPRGGVLMERVEFFGSAFLVPIFLISVGMLFDAPALLGDWPTLLMAVVFVAVAIAGKALAAIAAGRWLGFNQAEVGTVFSLSVTHAALALAAVTVALDTGIVGLGTVQAAIPAVVVTYIVGTWTANRWSQRLPLPPVRPPGIGESVLVPVANPESARGLVRLAALLARPESGTVMPLTVVGPEVSDEELARSRVLAARAESMALSQGVEATGLVRIDGSLSAGVLHTVVEHQATFMLIGWKGYAGTRESLFGSVIDEIVGRSSVPLAVTRLAGDGFDRILLSVFTGNLPLTRRPGVQLATEIARRVSSGTGVPLEVLTDNDDGAIEELFGDARPMVRRDTRRQHVAIGAHARAEDLLVVSVSPTDTGLRTAATRIAWAAPESSIIVALDAGIRRANSDEPGQRAYTWEMWLQP